MPHSHFGEFDCDFTANQFAAQSERICGKFKKKALFRRLIKLITSDEAINFSESFNLAANKKHERYRKNHNQKEK